MLPHEPSQQAIAENDFQIVCEFILHRLKHGVFLPYDTYPLIYKWLVTAPNLDVLLLILDDEFNKIPNLKASYKLRSLDRRIMLRLEKVNALCHL